MEHTGHTEQTWTYIDLFAGAGGLSEGFAECGFRPLAHVEMNTHACNTLKTRACWRWLRQNGNLGLYREYLKGRISRDALYNAVPKDILDAVICEEMSDETMPGIFQKIDSAMKRAGANHVDMIVGGPPCQAYSLVGRGRKDMSGDPRNHLYRQYLRALERYRPEVFVFENVPGLKTAGKGAYLQSIQSSVEALGYELEYHIQNASDYGVLQKRKRIILVGWRKGSGFHYPDLKKHKACATVGALLGDLPPLEPGEEKREYASQMPPAYLEGSGIRTADDILTWHVARRHIDRDREIYRIAIRKWFDDHEHLAYGELPPELRTHANASAFTDRFKVVERDDSTCHTMVAHIAKDGHYYIHPDIEQARSISVREAARIQSFPDNFFFEGPRTAAFMQIGNAVPPMLARAIAAAIREQFEERERQ